MSIIHPAGNLTDPASPNGRRAWLAVVAAYVLLFGGLLAWTGGLPYGIDNNESFSSLWHARSLYEHGIGQTKGLTNEVFAWHAEASPYVHTHQGNFPRVFAFVLYALGARTIESQIWLTTFTIGLAAIGLAFRFLRSLGPPLFAALACGVMMTNYALFTQWHVNTYRVWYAFFFFSSLCCVVEAGNRGGFLRYLLLFFNFAALAYWEYVFGLFVGLLSGIYALALFRRQWRRVAGIWLVQGAGAAVAAGLLMVQLVAYMGWDNVRKDIEYTLRARDMAADADFAREVTEFYARQKIIFWHNFQDTSKLKSLDALTGSFFSHHLQYYTPLIAFCVLTLLAGWLLGLLPWVPGIRPAVGGARASRAGQGFVRGALAVGALWVALSYFALHTLAHFSVIPPRAVSATMLAGNAVRLNWASTPGSYYEIEFRGDDENFRTIATAGHPRRSYVTQGLATPGNFHFRIRTSTSRGISPWRETEIAPGIPGTVARPLPWQELLVVACSLGLALLFPSLWTGKVRNAARLGWPRLVLVIGFLALMPRMLYLHDGLYDHAFENLWRDVFESRSRGWLASMAVLLAVSVAASFAAMGSRQLLGHARSTVLAKLPGFLLCCLAAYLLTYGAFTGYIYSGYLHRQAPFLVFATDILVGAALYLVTGIVVRDFGRRRQAAFDLAAGLRRRLSRRLQGRAGDVPLARSIPRAAPLLGGGLLLLLGAGAWGWLQVQYLTLLPPDSYSFVKRLNREPYKGKTFAVNTYPAPVAEKTGNWAYAESELFGGSVKLTPGGFATEHDFKYLWFADAESNPAYLAPEYGMIIVHPASVAEGLHRRAEWLAEQKGPPRVLSNGIAQRIAEPQAFARHQLVATDNRRFAIVKFDWDHAPFLKPVTLDAGQLPFSDRLAISLSGQEIRERWRVEISPLPGAEPGNGIVHLAHASVDSTSLFSARTLLDAGWSRTVDPLDKFSTVWDATAATRPLLAVASGNRVALRFVAHPRGGRVRISVNDVSDVIDLRAGKPELKTFAWTTAQPHGRQTHIPSFPPGIYVGTALVRNGNAVSAQVSYAYSSQAGAEERNTVFRLYQEHEPGRWSLAATYALLGADGSGVALEEFISGNPDLVAEHRRVAAAGDPRTFLTWLADHRDAHPDSVNGPGLIRSLRPGIATASDGTRQVRLPLPGGAARRIQVSVTPGAGSKSGPEYFGLPFVPVRAADLRPNQPEAVRQSLAHAATAETLPFGRLKVKLKFPPREVGRAQPIVTSGIEEAGDFIYVIYADAGHVRIGFDHWFKGGPLSPPIPVDYAAEQEFEISMGSLFPPADDVLFAGLSPERVATIKSELVVKLNGRTILDAPADFYESGVRQVTVGKNTIKGTTSDPQFTGEIISIERAWPDF